MASYILDPCVEDELWEIWRFIAKENPDAADRVLEAAHKTFQTLAENPRMGRRRQISKSRLHNLRSLPVSGFRNYLVFYSPTARGVEVFHVLHAARDIERLWKPR